MGDQNKNVPRLRFPGYTDAWVKCELGEILISHGYKQYITEANINGNYPVIQQGDKPIVGYSDNDPFLDYDNVLLFGDHTLSLFKPREPFLLATDGIKIISIENFDGEFTYYFLQKYNLKSEGYKRHFTILKNKSCFFPKDIEEQTKIGMFFKHLDNLITVNERELNKLKELKKSYLKDMFV